MIKRPMLSATMTEEGLSSVKYPVWVSPKLDGIRCLIHPELGPVTRSFKPIPNKHIRRLLSLEVLYGLDGELMLDKGDFNQVQSAVMRQDGEPLFFYHVFDNFMVEDVWQNRFAHVLPIARTYDFIVPVTHEHVYTKERVLAIELQAIGNGFEGVMLRDGLCAYKSGRATLREGGLSKLKRFNDDEGVVLRIEEQMHNSNELEHDEFGLAKRSSHKENLVGKGTLGKLILMTPKWGEVAVGTGFTDQERARIWLHRDDYIWKIVTFKYQEVLKDKPRFPVFLRFREEGL